MELMSTSLLASDSNLITFHSFPLTRSLLLIEHQPPWLHRISGRADTDCLQGLEHRAIDIEHCAWLHRPWGLFYPVAPISGCSDCLNRNSLSRLWLAAITCHSESTFSRPLSRKLRRALASLI